jgi:Tol biopolymer transport system component
MTAQPVPTRLVPRISRFDMLVALVILGLLMAIVVTIAAGDRVGVPVERYGPADLAASTTRVTLTFGAEMDWDSVIERLVFVPELTGRFRSRGRTLTFQPDVPLVPDTQYTVTLAAGASSTAGRQVLNATTYTFGVRPARVAYLAPADAAPKNIWAALPGEPPEQITFSPDGVLNFDVSPDGTAIAYAERNPAGTSDIRVLDLPTGATRTVTNCADADCDTPVWRPDGLSIAYHRIDLNSEFTALGVSPTRVWLADLTTNPPANRPLFSDNQILGYAPQWSADGQRIAIFDSNARGIVVYDLEDESLSLIPNRSGGSEVALAPDGNRVVFPAIIFDAQTTSARSILQLADLDSGEIRDLVDADAPVEDSQAVWHPDGRHLAIARRYTDARMTSTKQIYLLDTQTGDVEELVMDEQYFNGFFSWDPPGTQLVIQRFPLVTESNAGASARPQIWTYSTATGTLIEVADNAFLPQWLP